MSLVLVKEYPHKKAMYVTIMGKTWMKYQGKLVYVKKDHLYNDIYDVLSEGHRTHEFLTGDCFHVIVVTRLTMLLYKEYIENKE